MMNFNMATYKPFTYEELAAPIREAAKYHREIEEGLGTLATEASVWEKLADSALDKKEYEVYTKYKDSLAKQADDLLQHGVNPASYRMLMLARADYGSLIKPISDAWTLREKAREAELKAGDNVRWERSAFNRGLSDYIGGLPESRSVDLNKVHADISNEMASLRLTLMSARQLNLNPIQIEKIKLYGLTLELVEDFLTGNVSNDLLNRVVQGVMDRSGINHWNDLEARSSVESEINNIIRGNVYKGIGDIKEDIKTDEWKKMQTLWAHEAAVRKLLQEHEMNKLREAAAAKDSEKKKANVSQWSYSHINTPKEAELALGYVDGTNKPTEMLTRLYDSNGKLKDSKETRELKSLLQNAGVDITNESNLTIDKVASYIGGINGTKNTGDLSIATLPTVAIDESLAEEVIKYASASGARISKINGKKTAADGSSYEYDEDIIDTSDFLPELAKDKGNKIMLDLDKHNIILKNGTDYYKLPTSILPAEVALSFVNMDKSYIRNSKQLKDAYEQYALLYQTTTDPTLQELYKDYLIRNKEAYVKALNNIEIFDDMLSNVLETLRTLYSVNKITK